MSDKLSKIIEFAQQTGDKVIVTDKEGNDPVVVMPFEMYRHLFNDEPKKSREVENELSEGDDEVFFLPEEEYFDDLALEVSVPEPERIKKKPVKAQKPNWNEPAKNKDQSKQKKSLKLAEKETQKDDPKEEQFYM